MSTHLVIPDSHAHPDYSNRRFELLGRLIADIKPDVIIDIGDQADMASLCKHDRNTLSSEGNRYTDDIEASKDAHEKLFHHIKKRKKKLPRRIKCIGNHEYRIERAIHEDPSMQGKLSMNDLELPRWWDEVYDYLNVANVDGVAYSHFFPTGVLSRAISGPNAARTLLQKTHMSATMGHSHILDYSIDTKPTGKKIHGLVCGCFIDYDASYAGPANKLWWRGVVIKRNVEDGMYDPTFVSLKTLFNEYR